MGKTLVTDIQKISKHPLGLFRIHSSWSKFYPHFLHLKKRQKQKIIGLILAFFIFFGLLTSSFFGYQKAFANKIYPGITIGGVEVWGETKEQAKNLLDKKINQLNEKEITIVAQDQENQIKLADLGVSFNRDELVEKAYGVGRENNYWLRIPKVLATLVVENNIVLEPIFDQEKLKDALEKIAPQIVEEAKNATFKVENDQLMTVLSERGTRIDLEKFKKDLAGLVVQGSLDEKIILATQGIQPDITEDQLVEIEPEIEKMIKEPIILAYDPKNYTADKAEIASWIRLKADHSGAVEILFSDDEIKSFLDFISQKIDQKAIPRKIRSDNNQVVEEGRDGLEVDRDKALADIKDILNQRKADSQSSAQIALVIKETPRTEKIVAPEEINLDGGTPGLYEGKYIEIDLSSQIFYCWEGTNQICANQVSTGKWSMPTPTGTRSIESKDERAYSSKYNLYMPWWNSIGGGYGIHELPEWADGSKEGESHLGTPVSHGCIRLGVGPAEFVYHWAPEGTPVYIHK